MEDCATLTIGSRSSSFPACAPCLRAFVKGLKAYTKMYHRLVARGMTPENADASVRFAMRRDGVTT